MQSAEQLVLELSNPDLRENALLELSKVYKFDLIFFWIFLFHEFRRNVNYDFFVCCSKVFW